LSGKREFCATPPFAYEPTKDKIKTLHDDLISTGKGLVFANLLIGNDFTPSNFYETSITELHRKQPEVRCRSLIEKVIDKFVESPVLDTLNDAEKHFTLQLQITKEKAQNIEKQTFGQSFSEQWFIEREKRLTASNFGFVINRRKKIYPKSILKKQFSKQKFTSAACEWGISSEKLALKAQGQNGLGWGPALMA